MILAVMFTNDREKAAAMAVVFGSDGGPVGDVQTGRSFLLQLGNGEASLGTIGKNQ
jgi:hypothetical protein